jgi:hypothetical protein
MLNYQTNYLVTICPHYDIEIMSGKRRSGPTLDQCFHCKIILETSLTSWRELPLGGKILVGFSELVIPSWNFPLKALIGNLMGWGIVSGQVIALGGMFVFSYG